MMVEEGTKFTNVTVIKSEAVDYLLTKLRNKDTTTKDFMIYGDRVMRILAEEALARLPNVTKSWIETPLGPHYGLVEGEWRYEDLCCVSIMRSGDILQEAVRIISPGIKVGKILIQRDESTSEKKPIFFYKKLPNLGKSFVILVDPMLATGGSAGCAIRCLLEEGVKETQIIFLNLISCPEGIKTINQNFPEIRIITGAIDEYLTPKKFIFPGLGDYGDRYYGTQNTD